MTIRPVPQIALDFLQRAEGRPDRSYYDTGHVLTGGWGHTGPDVPPAGGTVPKARALAWLAQDAGEAARRLAGMVTADVLLGLTDHQYAALVSFVFNLGCKPGWTIWKTLNGRRMDQVPAQIMRFDRGRLKAGGPVVEIPGLAHRRAAEVALWKAPDVDAAVRVAAAAPTPPPSSAVTRLVDTPPTPAPPRPLAKTSLVTKIATLVGGAGAAAKAVNDVVAPHADVAPVFQTAVVACTGVIVVAGVVALWVSHRQEKARAQ